MSGAEKETLQGSSEEAGGLQMPKHVFKAPPPKTSLLGESGKGPDAPAASAHRSKRLGRVRRGPARLPRPQLHNPPPAALAPAGLDRLAAQKRAEQAKQGSLLGERRALAGRAGFPCSGRGGPSPPACPLARCCLGLPAGTTCLLIAAPGRLPWRAGKRPLMALSGEDEEGGGRGEGEGEEEGEPSGSGRGCGREPAGGGGGGGGGGREQRHYRGQRMDTPSHPGGVSQQAREAIADRERRLRERDREGVYVSCAAVRAGAWTGLVLAAWGDGAGCWT